MAVQTVLEKNGVPFHSVELGKVRLVRDLTGTQKSGIITGLKHFHLELIEGKNLVLVELIKTEIIRLLNLPHASPLKLSAHLSKTLDYNYTYLANMFSQTEGYTLEKFFITQRIERVKELMVYETKTLSDITEELNFSSVSHLCLQFKKVTGITPMDFKKLLQNENYVWRKI